METAAQRRAKFHQTHPEFYAGNQSARVVADRGGGVGKEPLTRHAIAT